MAKSSTTITSPDAALIHVPEPVLPVANERGERLLAIEPAACDAGIAESLDFALVLAVSQGRILLVRNRHRQIWELPGGLIDAGESPAQCALRELHEESGQIAADPVWLGRLILQADDGKSDGRNVHGALYRVTLAASTMAFAGNEEIESAALWPIAALPADTSSIDAELVRCYA